MRRVVVTGLGMVSPLGCGVDTNWRRLVAGENGFGRVEAFDVSDLPCKIAGIIPRGDGSDGTFNPDKWMEPKEQRKVDDFILYAISAATQALEDAGWHPESDEDQTATGVLIGSGIGGLNGIYETSITLKEKGPRRVSPFFIPGRLINLASGYVSIQHKLRGPNHAVVTACSTGAHAIGDAARMIGLGDADVMVAGGTESAVCRIGFAGFAACKALSTSFNDEPSKGSRPYDKDRDGFVMGEGAGCVVLEDYEHAKARGAKIYAEVIGYGLSSDAYHITAPAEDGDGAYRCMQMAVKKAGISVSDIDYINAHGTSTPMGDEIELKRRASASSATPRGSSPCRRPSRRSAISSAPPARSRRSSRCWPSATASRRRRLNLDNPSVDTTIDLVPHVAKKRQIDTVLSNSFGFGGTNASLVFRRVH